jgi:hypothetical protein
MVILSVIMLNAVNAGCRVSYCHAEGCYVECRYVECRGTTSTVFMANASNGFPRVNPLKYGHT